MKKDQKLIISGYPKMNGPNYQPQGNVAGTSVELIQMQNLMLNLNLHSKLPGNTCEQRNSRKISEIDDLGESLQESIYLSTTRKYCRDIGRADSDAEFDAESESAFKTARQYLRRKKFSEKISLFYPGK